MTLVITTILNHSHISQLALFFLVCRITKLINDHELVSSSATRSITRLLQDSYLRAIKAICNKNINVWG